jgi:hypothetical protein
MAGGQNVLAVLHIPVAAEESLLEGPERAPNLAVESFVVGEDNLALEGLENTH